MNKTQAFKIAKKTFDRAKPTRASGFCAVDGVVMIVGYEIPVNVVLYGDTDIHRLYGILKSIVEK